MSGGTILGVVFTFIDVWLHIQLAATMNLAVKRSMSRLSTRGLATPSASKGDFSKTLASGPGLDDFIRGEAVEEDTVVLGNTTQCVNMFPPTLYHNINSL
jgi:hypothetical protein